MNARWLLPVAAMLAGWPPADRLAAQDAMVRAGDLERRGGYAEAAEIYQAVLRDRPAQLVALLGLERVLAPLNRVGETVPPALALIAANPGAIPAYGVALRGYAARNQLDSLPALVERWAGAAPGDETPYREWAAAALQRRDRAMARRAYQTGRARLGKPEVLAAEIAQLAALDEDWPTAAGEWLSAIRSLEGYRSVAATSLGAAPERAHGGILEVLDHTPGQAAPRLAADLRARWGDPEGAFRTLQGALPPERVRQIEVLQGFLELVRLQSTPPYARIQARTLEALADRWIAGGQRARLRLDAARAYTAAGDEEDARRILAVLAADPAGEPAVAAGAAATLIELLARDGKAGQAAGELDRARPTLPPEEYRRLRRAVAWGWARSGDIPRAEALLAADSSVEAVALLGRFRLYTGDVAGAVARWREAGPYAGGREEATWRSVMLAMLQGIGTDSAPALGAAFRTLDTGDTAAAAGQFEAAAGTLAGPAARGEILVFAGRLFGEAGRMADAERLFGAAVDPASPGAAAAALLALGRLQLGLGRREAAAHTLERLILEYPASALVPQARRLLDETRGAVPET